MGAYFKNVKAHRLALNIELWKQFIRMVLYFKSDQAYFKHGYYTDQTLGKTNS